jgi:ribulose-5-phosphate 4-epimerase/fuculose-1-phosphate aldolase
MLVTVDECGKDPAGGTPTKDMPMHLGILKQRPDMGVVCHVHNSYIIAASAMLPPGSDTLPPLTPGFVYYAYPLPMLPFLPPGSQELAEAAAEKLSRHDALLLQSHGLITLGRDFPHAVNMAEEIEEAARIFVLSRGTAKSISQEHIQKIRRK